jgi:hypothetical protein
MLDDRVDDDDNKMMHEELLTADPGEKAGRRRPRRAPWARSASSGASPWRSRVVTPTCVSGAAPTMTGGTIAYGTYVLVSATVYPPLCTGVTLPPPGGPTTLLVSPGCVQSIDAQGGAKTYTWTASGDILSMTEVCPGSGSQPVISSYAATATNLTELVPFSPAGVIVSVFQKR